MSVASCKLSGGVAKGSLVGVGKTSPGQDVQWKPAIRRAEIFPPDTIKEDGYGNSDVSAWALVALQRALAQAGMPAGQAAHYTDLVWRCNENLSYKPQLEHMAEDWGETRQTLSAKIRVWLGRGYLRRERVGWGGQYVFYFPCYADLIAMVAGAPRDKRKDHTPAHITRKPVFAGKEEVSTGRKEILSMRGKEQLSAPVKVEVKQNQKLSHKAAARAASPPPTSKPPKAQGSKNPKATPRNPHADAFKVAFDARFPAGYKWRKSDFVQLVKWLKENPDVTPEGFANTAVRLWEIGEYCPSYALSICGMAASWDKAQAKLALQGKEAAESQAPRLQEQQDVRAVLGLGADTHGSDEITPTGH